MEIDDIVIKIKVVAEDAKNVIQTITSSLDGLAKTRDALTGDLNMFIGAAGANEVISALGTVAALKRELEGGVSLGFAGSLPIIPETAEYPAGEYTGGAGGGVDGAEPEDTNADFVLTARGSYYDKLLDLVKNREDKIFSEIWAQYTALEAAKIQGILDLIRDYYDAFAEAGNALGGAFADAFNERLGSIEAAMAGASPNYAAEPGQGPATGFPSGATINFNQTIAASGGLSPAQIARETRAFLENAMRVM